MPTRPPRSGLRIGTLGALALVAGALVLVAPLRGAGDSVLDVAASGWRAVFADRPSVALSQRMIVVLETPSLASKVAAEDEAPSADEQRRWTAEAEASQRLLLARLRERGLRVRRDFSFTRTFNGFSAVLDARALAELERADGVVGVYPVRSTYPASVASRVLRLPEFGLRGGRRPDVSVRGLDGRTVTIALLDTGVDLGHPYLGGRVLPGHDVVSGDSLAAAEPKPDEPGRLETHGTQMAGILVGAGGPGRLRGVAPRALVLPIRVLGWQETEEGSVDLVGRTDQLLAGIERAVDPDGDGDVEDGVRVALAAVVAPYAAFANGPEARATNGAADLGTLVVAAAGNDGPAGAGFGTVAAPAAARAALAVGAVDARRHLREAHVVLRAGLETVFEGDAPVLGPVFPELAVSAAVAPLVGPTLGDPKRPADAVADGSALADFFDGEGMSRVAGRAALVPAGGAPLAVKARNAAAAGAAALIVYGSTLPAGGLDLDEGAALPVVAVPDEAGRTAADAVARGVSASLALGAGKAVANPAVGRVAGFSSHGLAFDWRVKPELVAPGVGIATADAGANGDGTARFATVTGSSAAAALAAGAAALLVQARPDLGALELKSALVGSAAPLAGNAADEPPSGRGAGVLDARAALEAELAVEPATLGFGRVTGPSWSATRRITIRNLSSRPLEVGFSVTPALAVVPPVDFAADPARVALDPGASVEVALVASAAREARGVVAGTLLVAADGARPVRVPWAVAFTPPARRPLVGSVSLSHAEFAPSLAAPAVLVFRAGRVDRARGRRVVHPVARLDVELWTAGGERLGRLARLRHLLPGRYALGLTGRGPNGEALPPGSYEIRLRARPVAGAGRPSTAKAVFSVTS